MTVADLKTYKNSLYSALSRELSEFEKNFILITGAILAFSITFIQGIVKIETANWFILLFLSWAFISIAVGIMMFAFLTSARSSDKLYKKVDEFLLDNLLLEDHQILDSQKAIEIKRGVNLIHSDSKSLLNRMRISAILSFFIGIGLLGTFVGINIINEGSKVTNNIRNLTISASGKDSLKIEADNIQVLVTDSIIISKKE